MNQAPDKPLMRLGDVLAWLPQVTREELRTWEELGWLHPFRKAPGAHRWYRTAELQQILQDTNGHRVLK